MMINFGYACIAPTVPGTALKSCIMRNASAERLSEIIAHNLEALKRMVKYNKENDIHLFRISSELIPFGSSPVNTLPWQALFLEAFQDIAKDISSSSQRVSVHPGQYTVINSPNKDVVSRAIEDLIYHDQVLTLLKADRRSKIILHVGGIYGDKKSAVEQFCFNWQRLNDSLKSRIVIENDEHCFNISEVITIAQTLGIPAVFDNLHHAINPPEADKPVGYWISKCAETWKKSDGRQKIHYSQQKAGGKSGAHSKTIYSEAFLQFYNEINSFDLDMMLEVKDKNLSVVKCRLLTSNLEDTTLLEKEWTKYKYSVMAHSPEAYSEICTLLENDSRLLAKTFYSKIEQALDAPAKPSGSVNLMLYIWDTFKDIADPVEKKRFFSALEKLKGGKLKADTLKNQLVNLAVKYDKRELIGAYLFL